MNINNPWYKTANFYHIYPLGLLGAPEFNHFQTEKTSTTIRQCEVLLPYLKDMGINAIYLGPLFSSTKHGYDTADYFKLDERLGTWEDLQHFMHRAHEENFKVILDAVFNHVG